MLTRRELAAIERCVEQDAKRAERLPAPLWSKTDQHDVAVTMPDVQCRCVTLEVFLTQQIT